MMGIMRPQDFGWRWSRIGLALFFYGLYLLTKRKGFGLGDVKLAPSLGLLGLRGHCGDNVVVYERSCSGCGVAGFGEKEIWSNYTFWPLLGIRDGDGLVVA